MLFTSHHLISFPSRSIVFEVEKEVRGKMKVSILLAFSSFEDNESSGQRRIRRIHRHRTMKAQKLAIIRIYGVVKLKDAI
jgi:hypothetical protein